MRKLLDVLVEHKMVHSKKEGFRMLQSNAVSLNQEKVSDPYHVISEETIIRVGKHRWLKVVLS